MHTHNHSFNCVIQPLSLHSRDLFTSVLLPLSVSGLDHTAGRHAEFPNCPKNIFFRMNAHTYSRMSPISHINIKWQQCHKGSHAEPVIYLFILSWMSPTHFWHIWVVPFEFAWTQASPQIPIQPAVPLSLCRCAFLKSMATLALSSCCAAKIIAAMAISNLPSLMVQLAASRRGQRRSTHPLS